MRWLNSLRAMLLSLLIVMAGQGVAFAKSQAPVDGTMVLCTGHGSVVIYVDESGQPTSAPQLCADCAQALVAVAIGPFQPDARKSSFRAAEAPAPRLHHSQHLIRTGSARAPPVL